MDNFGINRLNLAEIFKKHMSGHRGMRFFHPTIIQHNNNNKTEDINRYNLQERLQTMIAHVHSQIKESEYYLNSAIEAQISSNSDNKPQAKVKSSIHKEMAARPKRNSIINIIAEDKIKKKVLNDNLSNITLSIPRLKVLCQDKEQKRLCCTIPPYKDDNNYIHQKRLAEIKQKNALLSSMVEDQKQLQLDRQSITREVCIIRNNIENIRGRLDTSIKKLRETKFIAK
ncbi:uncharacterized protein LOC106083691 [Stomoxys calcitrans]|uniref:uncharacterized protein LOC106083691 n=1 Tax=Stomoxys calcitrans TaxID=35570 RepID=UPI0027E39FD4|nr:uncharacterized protein LOC106083691 [Stomoxys calcitrans]